MNYFEHKRSELNSKLWSSSTDDNSPGRKQARNQKRKLRYITNILIVDDPNHPELRGQVKLFEFGKKIFDKINDKARPTFEDETPIDVFNPFVGANFKLRQCKVEGYANYDKSVFADQSPIAGTDAEILDIMNRQFALDEFTDPKNFKSYDELAKKLAMVLDDSGVSDTARSVIGGEEDEAPIQQQQKKRSNKKIPVSHQEDSSASDDGDDAALDYFRKIAAGEDED